MSNFTRWHTDSAVSFDRLRTPGSHAHLEQPLRREAAALGAELGAVTPGTGLRVRVALPSLWRGTWHADVWLCL